MIQGSLLHIPHPFSIIDSGVKVAKGKEHGVAYGEQHIRMTMHPHVWVLLLICGWRHWGPETGSDSEVHHFKHLFWAGMLSGHFFTSTQWGRQYWVLSNMHLLAYSGQVSRSGLISWFHKYHHIIAHVSRFISKHVVLTNHIARKDSGTHFSPQLLEWSAIIISVWNYFQWLGPVSTMPRYLRSLPQ